MTETASKELCAELYKLTGWGNTYHYYDADDFVDTKFHAELMSKTQNCPAYSCGYLLRKLPQRRLKLTNHLGYWRARYSPDGKMQIQPEVTATADTPEDALTKLAIELVKQGIVPKGEK